MTQPHIAIDLTRHHFMLPIGDMVLFGTWVFNSGQEAEEPALVIVPRYRQNGFKPAVIALSAAYKYNPCNRAEARGAVHNARQFALGLGLSDSMADCHKILTMIHDHVGDLVSIPPSPMTAIIVGEASIELSGKKHSFQMVDYEPTPQA